MKRVALIIPCYRVSGKILDVIAGVGEEVSKVYVVDDKCPENSGNLVERECTDPRVKILFNEQNQGVGGATLTGFRAALEDNMDVLVKLDGDGQMEPHLIKRIVAPVLAGQADFAKGNRFFDPEGLSAMPLVRLFGNAVLSFMSKLSSGYWNVFDPTNGFFAIDARVVSILPLDKIARRYFFESDLLFRLGTFRAKIVDIPMKAVYGDESSSLKVSRVAPEFLFKHLRNFAKRFFYCYLLRDFSVASVGFLLGVPMLIFGIIFGCVKWWLSFSTGVPVSSGTVMLSALPVILGTQFLLVFLNYDINLVPRETIARDCQ